MWTLVPKPTGSNWTTVNPVGREQYDQASLTYDDSSTFYDGVDETAWSMIAKPTTGLTWNEATFSWDSADETPWESPQWNLVAKPTT